jgi:hypothetical protein
MDESDLRQKQVKAAEGAEEVFIRATIANIVKASQNSLQMINPRKRPSLDQAKLIAIEGNKATHHPL